MNPVRAQLLERLEQKLYEARVAVNRRDWATVRGLLDELSGLIEADEQLAGRPHPLRPTVEEWRRALL